MPPDHTDLARDDRIRLTHMLEAAERVERYCLGHTLVSIQTDEMRLLAVVKSIEIIGEASTKVSQVTRDRVPAIDWSGIRRMRNRLIHGYDTIDVARVWDAVQIDIAPLAVALRVALAIEPGT